MKLKKFSIENFKSIKVLKDHVFHDDKINCFIGQNGSGKSNILYALASLQDDKYLTDDSLNEDSEITKNKIIRLNATFVLEKNDEDRLKELGFKGVREFVLNVEKSRGGEILRSVTPVDYNDERTKELKKSAKEIYSEIKQLEMVIPDPIVEEIAETPQPEAAPDAPAPEVPATEPIEVAHPESLQDITQIVEASRDDIETKIKLAITADTIDSYSNLKEEIAAFLAKMDSYKIESSAITPLFEDFKNTLELDITSAITEIFKSLSINLLNLDYNVEGSALIKDLNDPNTHPFLFDLLKLSEVSAEEFQPKTGRALAGLQNSASKKLTDEISKYWITHRLQYRIERHDGNLCFFFYTKQGAQIELDNLSAGEQWYLKFFVKLAIAIKESQKVIWLFDEPGQFLHASSQIDLKNFFEANTSNSQIIYTTHQPMMMQWQRLERLYVVENLEKLDGQEVYGSALHQRFWKDAELVSPLREALGLFIGEELLTGKEHIVIEGISDYFFLIGWLRHFGNKVPNPKWLKNYSDSRRTFVPADGKANIPLYCLFLTRKTKKNINCIAIPDSKNDSDEIKAVLEKYGLDNFKEITKDLATISGNPELNDIEELFEPSEYLVEVAAFYEKTYPDIRIAKKFVEEYDVKVKLIDYIEKSFTKENPELFSRPEISFDKTGVAQFIHDKLVWDNSKYSKKAEENFEKVLVEFDKLFKKKAK